MELVSTGGTGKLLRDSGISVKDISELTGFPEMLDGRVKTLHPKVPWRHPASPRRIPSIAAAVAEHGIPAIDMVVVNLYAFEKTASKPGAPLRRVNRKHRHRWPFDDLVPPPKIFTTWPSSRRPLTATTIADEMSRSGGALSSKPNGVFAQKAFATAAAYDSAIASTLERVGVNGHFELLAAGKFPANAASVISENDGSPLWREPSPEAAMYSDGSDPGSSQRPPTARQGTFLQPTSLDLQAAWDLAQDFDETVCAIVKHTNPCGVALPLKH